MNTPPKWIIRLLRWFCKPYYLEIIEGDLYEIYEREANLDKNKASFNFIISTMKFFRLRFIKNIEDFKPQSSYGMFKNYFKVSIRSIRKNLTYSLLNVLGLSVGVASCLLIILHISYQFTFDDHVENREQVYRLTIDWGNRLSGYTPAPAVDQMLQDFPELHSGTRITSLFEVIIKTENEYVKQEGVTAVDSTFFDVFPTKFIIGDPQTALNGPNDVVLTETVSRKLFGDENPIGEKVESDDGDYIVTAVIEDSPNNSTIPYKVLVSIPHEWWATNGYWTGNNFFSYLRLNQNADPESLRSKFPEFVETYMSSEILRFAGDYDTWEEYIAEDKNYRSFEVVPLSDIHLNHARLTLNNPGSRENVLIFSVIAFFILLIACINYINMSTAKSSLRCKEVGMRKVLGSDRKQIIQQFLIESLLITCVSLILGIFLALLALPYFNVIAEIEYSWTQLLSPSMLVWTIVLLLVVGLLAGSYPAFYLSSFKPTAALRGENVRGSSSKIRIGLVIFQFAISVFLITGTLIVFQQVDHLSNRNLGIQADQIFVLENGAELGANYQPFINQLNALSEVEQIGLMSQYPSGFIADWSYNTVGDNIISLSPDHMFIDKNALQTLGLELVSGDFFKGMALDSSNVIVNETFVKQAGWEDPIGKMLDRGEGRRFRVIGVIKDFVLRSGKRNVRAGLFRFDPKIEEGNTGGPFIHIKINGNYQETLSEIESIWESYVPGFPFDGFFLSDSFDRLYSTERRFGMLFTSFSGLAILIASIGLFALAAFSLERRMKEIAIRKVMGASAENVIYLVSWSFLKLILIGSVISFPVVYYFGNDWLNKFSYRIEISPFLIIIPIIAVALVSLAIVGLKTYKTAMDNPVNSLKAE